MEGADERKNMDFNSGKWVIGGTVHDNQTFDLRETTSYLGNVG